MRVRFIILVFRCAAILILVLGARALARTTSSGSDSVPSPQQAQITAVTVQQLNPSHDRANVVHVYHIVVFGRYALADWTARQGGGKTALAQSHGAWRVIGVGDLRLGAAALEKFGVPSRAARILAERMRQAWEEE
ncbi:MAG: hypothetical protein GIW99_02510 [Candidatus Eremiobacteraeota bacterium]|nr:hypothetical protein [Candidatus Eremiobacteraeota bacterium]MBC5826547.1 hypothetical protein [Candidatus Eremiobacteraeota bacterium]